MSVDNNKGRYNELDALRGIAAIMVAFFHFSIGRPEAQLGLKFGKTGVDLFFIISGFVIYMSINKVKTGIDFVINRVSRLYPTYWASVTFTFAVILCHCIYKSYSPDVGFYITYLGNLTMFQHYLGLPDLDGPYWTLIIEMLFYIAILMLFHFNKLKYLNAINLSVIALLLIVTHYWGFTSFVKNLLAFIPLLQFVPLFFAGITFYRLYHNLNNKIFNYLILLFCFLSQIAFFEYVGRTRYILTRAEYAVVLFAYFALFTLFVNSKLGFIVSKKALFLGKISYALYLIHQYISLEILVPFFVDYLHINFWIAAIFIVLPTVIAIAAFITFYIEIPFSRKMKVKLKEITAKYMVN